MDIPGLKLYPLKGKLKGRWAIRCSGRGLVCLANYPSQPGAA